MQLYAWLFLVLLAFQVSRQGLAYEFDVDPPDCVWAIFVHTPKTGKERQHSWYQRGPKDALQQDLYAGGTHLRWTFGHECCEENSELWNSTIWAWSMQKHVRAAEQDPQYLLDWLHGRGGRVFSELHLHQDISYTIPSLRRLEKSEIWQQSGCKLWIWTMVRCRT